MSTTKTTAGAKSPVGAWAKLGRIQQEVGPLPRTGLVSYGNTKYRHFQEAGCFEVVRPLLKKYNCAVVVDFKDHRVDGNHTYMTAKMRFVDCDSGEEITAEYPNEAVDSSDKGSSKTATQAMKYAWQKFFVLEATDIEDADVDNPPPSVKAKPKPELSAEEKVLIEEADAKAKKTIEAGDLTRGRYDALKATAVTEGKIAEFHTWVMEEGEVS